MLLPGRGLAIVNQLDLQDRQRPRFNRHQNWLPSREDLITQQKDDPHAWQYIFGQGLGISREPLRNIPDRRKRQSQLPDDLRDAFERTMSLQPQQKNMP